MKLTYKCNAFLEVSAKNGQNINRIFELVASTMIPGMSPQCADKTCDRIIVDDNIEEDYQNG